MDPKPKNTPLSDTLPPLSFANILAMIFLSGTLIVLVQRILFDVARAILTSQGNLASFISVGYFSNPEIIKIHGLIIIPLLVIMLVLYVFALGKNNTLRTIVIPYVITSIIVGVQYVMQLTGYFIQNYSDVQFYAILGSLIIFLTTSIIFLEYDQEGTDKKKTVIFGGASIIFLIIVSVILIGIPKSVSPSAVPLETEDSPRPYGTGLIPMNPDLLLIPVAEPDELFNNNQPNQIENIPQVVARSQPESPVERAERIRTEENMGTGDTDSTPRIMYWSGKVNQHWDITANAWRTDSDGVSGARIPLLEYCQKFYPNTIFVRPYREETISTWRAAGNTDRFTGTHMSYECVGE
jgi:hypothetical protein